MGAPTFTYSELHYHLFQTELGLMLLGLGNSSICFLHLDPSGSLPLHTLKENFPRASLTPTTEQHASLIREAEGLIHRVLRGDSSDELPSLILKGTPFQQEVRRHL